MVLHTSDFSLHKYAIANGKTWNILYIEIYSKKGAKFHET